MILFECLFLGCLFFSAQFKMVNSYDGLELFSFAKFQFQLIHYLSNTNYLAEILFKFLKEFWLMSNKLNFK